MGMENFLGKALARVQIEKMSETEQCAMLCELAKEIGVHHRGTAQDIYEQLRRADHWTNTEPNGYAQVFFLELANVVRRQIGTAALREIFRQSQWESQLLHAKRHDEEAFPD